MDYAFLQNTGDKDAKVTFLTMVDNSSGSMVVTAVKKKGHDKFVERCLLKGLESFGVTGEMVLQTDKETGPIDVAKHVAAAERKATTIIGQTPKKSSLSASVTLPLLINFAWSFNAVIGVSTSPLLLIAGSNLSRAGAVVLNGERPPAVCVQGRFQLTTPGNEVWQRTSMKHSAQGLCGRDCTPTSRRSSVPKVA